MEKSKHPTIAVLALQGAFGEHEKMLRSIGIDSFEVRQLADWQRPKDGLIIPGGESTVQLKLLRDLRLLEPIREAIESGLPVFGTCAGLILLAKSVEGEDFDRLSTMDIDVRRNASTCAAMPMAVSWAVSRPRPTSGASAVCR